MRSKPAASGPLGAVPVALWEHWRSVSQFRALTLGSPGQFARVSLLSLSPPAAQGPAFRSRAGLVPTSPTDSDEDLKLGLKSLSDASDDTCATLCVAPLPVQLPNLEWEIFFRTVELPK